MKWLTNFRKRYRRYGSVKMAMLLFVLAFCFLVQSGSAVAKYAGFADKSVEYTITVNNPGGVQDSDLLKLKGLDHVICISPQREFFITCVSGTETKMLPVVEVYADYLQAAYGICTQNIGNCFYLNENAWKEIAADSAEKSIYMPYSEDGLTNKTAQLHLNEGLNHALPMAYTSGNSVSLAGCKSIRMMTEKTDITGKTLEDIQAMGYSVENEQEIREGIYELEIVMLKLKYSFIIAGLLIAFGYTMKKESFRITEE